MRYLLMWLLLITIGLPAIQAKTEQLVPVYSQDVEFVIGSTDWAYFLDGISLPKLYEVIAAERPECLEFDAVGNVRPGLYSPTCCGTFTTTVTIRSLITGDVWALVELTYTIICPKPDCEAPDLTFLVPIQDPEYNPNKHCRPACELSTVNYSITLDEGFTAIDWVAENGTVTASTGESATVEWGSAGSGTVGFTLVDPQGVSLGPQTYCVELNPLPQAGFTIVEEACSGTTVTLVNTSVGGSIYTWDFGDGTDPVTGTAPQHSYAEPGNYTITMTASTGGVGALECCCIDEVTQTIIVQPGVGPEIVCAGTACSGDVQEYSAANSSCDTYEWSVENGEIISGQGTATVSVIWNGTGNGVLQLSDGGCSGGCTLPTQLIIPVVQNVSNPVGATEVCAGQSAVYSLPDWPGVCYEWSSDFGSISGSGSTIQVTWPNNPGTYNLEVTYSMNLPGEDVPCTGSGTLTVTALREMMIDGPDLVCLGENGVFSVTNNWDNNQLFWTITPPVVPIAFGSEFEVIFDAPGTYVISADLQDPSIACGPIPEWTVFVPNTSTVVIEGQETYCPGEVLVYEVTNHQAGMNYEWEATGATLQIVGATTAWVTPDEGVTSITVSVFGNTSTDPACSTPVTTLTATVREGENQVLDCIPFCKSQQSTFEADLSGLPDGYISWSISPVEAGSIAGDETSLEPLLEWNEYDGDDVTLELTISQCDGDLVSTYTWPVNLLMAAQPEIVDPILCPNDNTELFIQEDFAVLGDDGDPDCVPAEVPVTYQWSVDGNPATPSIFVSEPGFYAVTTTDKYGCQAVDNVEVIEKPAPDFRIDVMGGLSHCICSVLPPNTILSVNLGQGESVRWFLNGVFLSNSTSIEHTFSNDEGVFFYTAVVTNEFGCSTEKQVVITQLYCCPDDHVFSGTHEIEANNVEDNCDIFKVVATYSGTGVFAPTPQWVLPPGTTVLGTDNSPGESVLEIRLPEADCYKIVHLVAAPYSPASFEETAGEGIRDCEPPGIFYCLDSVEVNVCVPVRADFALAETCGELSIQNHTTVIDDNLPVTYTWTITGDVLDFPIVINGEDPVVPELPENGVYTVSLEAFSPTSPCTSRWTEEIEIQYLNDGDIVIVTPEPYCVGQPISFVGTGTNMLTWMWDFGDGSVHNGQAADHAYSAPGTYEVSLVPINIANCELDAPVTHTIAVRANPSASEITATPSATICEGSSTVLSLSQNYTSYLWSTGAATPTTLVSNCGDYFVTVTEANGDDPGFCERVIGPFTVLCAPNPEEPIIIGDREICSDESSQLSIVPIPGFTYTWMVNGFQFVSPTYTAFGSNGDQSVSLTVTNELGCSTTVSGIEITVGQTPEVSITATGSSCGFDQTVLAVTNPQTNVDYLWSTGETGASITVSAPGVYTVTAGDVDSDCSATAVHQIIPGPEICGLPNGCYTACKGDVFCVPVLNEEWTYEWFDVDGNFVQPGACLVTEEIGSNDFYLQVTDENGCSSISDVITFEVIACLPPCALFAPTLTPVATDEINQCCFNLSYSGGEPDAVDFVLGFPEGEFDILEVDPDFIATPGTSGISFANVNLQPLPSDVEDLATICFVGAAETFTSTFSIVDLEGNVLCSEEAEVACEVNDPCEPFMAIMDLVEGGDPDQCCFSLSYEGAMSDIPAIRLSFPLIEFDVVDIQPGFIAPQNDQNIIFFRPDLQPIPEAVENLATICFTDLEAGSVASLEIRNEEQGFECSVDIPLNCAAGIGCGEIITQGIACKEEGVSWSGTIQNNNDQIVTAAEIVFEFNGVTFSELFVGLNVEPGGQQFLGLQAPGAEIPVGEICYEVILYFNTDFSEACSFGACVANNHPCPTGIDGCACDERWEESVAAGFNVWDSGVENAMIFSPRALDRECDQLSWFVPREELEPSYLGSDWGQSISFPSDGVYTVCMSVIRVDDKGQKCTAEFCDEITIGDARAASSADIRVYPNPTDGQFVVEADLPIESLGIFSLDGRKLRQVSLANGKDAANRCTVNVHDLQPGVYLLRGVAGDQSWVRRLVVK